MGDENKGPVGGAVRKTEEGGKTPSPEELKAAADKKAADEKAAKGRKAANDKASKAKREKEAAAKKAAEALAAERRGAYIKPGLAITSGKGTKAGAPKGGEVWEGDKVTPEMFGEGVYKRLVESGAIVVLK